MKKFTEKYKLYMIIFTVLFILLYLILTVKYKTNLNRVEAFLKDKLLLIEDKITPKVKIDNNNIIEVIESDKDKEIKELKKLLDINTNTKYSIINSKVISRGVNTYLNELTIDKGTKDGVEKDMAVVNSDGLIGIIKYSTDNYSVVELLTSSLDNLNIAVSISDDSDSYNGIIDGYNVDEKYLNILSIRSTSNIKEGAIVSTNALGGLIPAGIYVGTVEKITFDKTEVNKILKVKSNVDFDNIRYVSIIRDIND